LSFNKLFTMKPDALKHAMYYGLFLGVIFSLNFFLTTFKSVPLSILNSLVTCAIPFISYWLTVDCRKKVCEDVMTYGAALWYGIQLFFYASLISTAFKFIYFSFINPDFLKGLIHESLRLLDEMNLKSFATAEQMQELLTPMNLSLQYIWINVLIGIFVSFITAAFAKKSAPPIENNDTNTIQPNN